ncbi:MAG TPA: hypothetical protein VG097_16775, partial [Gemmata sp.]|nr:hypothetical protein [Gemmata sp.]
MPRFFAAILIAGLAFAFSSGTASAQFRGVFMGPSPLYIYPTGNGYGVGMNFGVTGPSPYGPVGFGFSLPYNLSPSYSGGYSPGYSPSYGYLTGGSYSAYDTYGLQMDLANAQNAAAKARRNQDEARDLIDAQWAYEKLGVTGKVALTGAQEQAEELQKALVVKDEAEIAAGTALNRILIAIVVAEGKGAKGVAAFLPPRLLDDLRFKGFKGEASADLLNLVRQSGRIPFPNNFPGASLAELQVKLEADFEAAITPLQNGKAVDPNKVNKLEASLKKLEAAAPPVIRTLAFDDAIAARRFLNQFDSAIKALRGANLSGLINPKWATDGISAADLVKHMTKYKLMFAQAPTGGEGSYITLHKAMATYLFVLTQAK